MQYEVVSGGKILLVTENGADAWAMRNKIDAALPPNHSLVFVRQVLEEKSHSVALGDISAYRFWFKDSAGWAFFYIDSATNVLSIISDWGDYSYRWHNIGEQTLEEFIASSDCDYLTRKLLHGKENRKEFKLLRSLANVKEHICKARRRNYLSAARARELWIWADGTLVCCENDQDLYREIMDNEEFADVSTEMPELFIYEPKDSTIFLKESLLPFFQSFLKKHNNWNSL